MICRIGSLINDLDVRLSILGGSEFRVFWGVLQFRDFLLDPSRWL